MSHTNSATDPAASSAAAVAASRARVQNPGPELAEAIARGYEPHDVRLRGVFIFLVTLVVSLVIVLFVMWGLMSGILSIDRSNDPAGTPVTINRGPQYAPLQPSGEHKLDTDDMLDMRQKVDAKLNGSGAVRSEAGERRYQPIDTAIDQVLPMIQKLRPARATTKPS